MFEFSRWLACPVVAQHAISEVPLRAPVDCVAQAPRGGEGMCSCSENIDVCQHHLEVARDNSLRRGDGRWRGHQHSVDPSERRTERTFGSTGPGRAKLERAGVNLDHLSLWRRNSLRKRLRFARNGGHHRNTRRIGGSCFSDRGSFAGLYSDSHYYFVYYCA